jgi:hypothetical protein
MKPVARISKCLRDMGRMLNDARVHGKRLPACILTETRRMDSFETARLKLIPANLALARAEIGDRGEFARLLGASVPDNWPPESLADALPLFLQWMEAAPDQVGWFGWYGLAAGDGAEALVLVASGGFKGPPQDGTPKSDIPSSLNSSVWDMRRRWWAGWFDGRFRNRVWNVLSRRPNGPIRLRCAF